MFRRLIDALEQIAYELTVANVLRVIKGEAMKYRGHCRIISAFCYSCHGWHWKHHGMNGWKAQP